MPAAVPLPSISMIGASVHPGWDVPSMITGSVMNGRAESSRIVWAPDGSMSKSISSGVMSLGDAFAALIASRSEQCVTIAREVIDVVGRVDRELERREQRGRPVRSGGHERGVGRIVAAGDHRSAEGAESADDEGDAVVAGIGRPGGVVRGVVVGKGDDIGPVRVDAPDVVIGLEGELRAVGRPGRDATRRSARGGWRRRSASACRRWPARSRCRRRWSRAAVVRVGVREPCRIGTPGGIRRIEVVAAVGEALLLRDVVERGDANAVRQPAHASQRPSALTAGAKSLSSESFVKLAVPPAPAVTLRLSIEGPRFGRARRGGLPAAPGAPRQSSMRFGVPGKSKAPENRVNGAVAVGPSSSSEWAESSVWTGRPKLERIAPVDAAAVDEPIRRRRRSEASAACSR